MGIGPYGIRAADDRPYEVSNQINIHKPTDKSQKGVKHRMRINDETRSLDVVMQELVLAIDNNDKDQFKQLYAESLEIAKRQVAEQLKTEQDEAAQAADSAVLRDRGSNVLTTAEQKFYTEWIQAMKADNPKQAVDNLKAVFPETVVERVMDDLRQDFPLLNAINFVNTSGVTKFVLDKSGVEEATWGDLCDEIVKEISAGFEVVQADLFKLSAFLPVCEQGITFGPNWLDAYLRAKLYNSIGNGAVRGFVDGTGKKEPIGMTRVVGPTANVVNGVYPRKAAIAVQDFDDVTMGNLLAMMATDDNGKERDVDNVILVCNPVDYLKKIKPAIYVKTPTGEYRLSLPYPMTVIPVNRGLPQGKAVLGLGKRYIGMLGSPKKGVISYSDEFRWLQDQRVYKAKFFGNGMPLDNNAFLYLDISGLLPARYLVQTSENTPSSDATLADLAIGTLAFDSAFDPTDTSYTASTTNATDVLRAVPAQADAVLECKLGDTVVNNGTPLTWAAGSNTVTVKVTAPDGSTTKTYTVTVTKS